MQKHLVFHVPVLHRGYLEFLEKNRDRIEHAHIISEELLAQLTDAQPDIAAIGENNAMSLLVNGLGFTNVSILTPQDLRKLEGEELILIQDDIGRALHKKHFSNHNIEWVSVFLRWDKASVASEDPLSGVQVSEDPADIRLMNMAYQEAQKSGDWWRQVGAILVQNGDPLLEAYNQGIPHDHAPYQVGAVRDFFEPGERPELANYIHAEQKIIAQAARQGIPLQDAALYVTHFPCPVCSKLIAFSGIKNLYFGEGSSVLQGKEVLGSAGCTIQKISVILEQ